MVFIQKNLNRKLLIVKRELNWRLLKNLILNCKYNINIVNKINIKK